MYVYDKLFTEYNHTVAQMLLSGEDLEKQRTAGEFSKHALPVVGIGCIADCQ